MANHRGMVFCQNKSESSSLLNYFRHFHYKDKSNESTHSNAAYHQLMILTSEIKFTYGYEGSRSFHATALH